MNIKLRIKGITIILIIFLIFMGLPLMFELTSVHSTVEATTTRYVGGTGPGNYSKIQDAIDDANSGDIIRVYSGTYYENVIVNKTVTLIGNGIGNTILNGGGNYDVVYVTADLVNIINFTIRNSGSGWYDAGIEIYYSDHCKIEYCSFPNNERGIYLEYSSFNIIRNNTCNSNQWEGIQLSYSSNNLIENNTCSNNWDGIQLFSSSSNTFINNIFSNNQEAISMDLSSDNILYDNSMSSCGLRIFGVSLSEWNTHTISANNTVNGKPLYYWKNRNGGTIPSGAGQIILVNCNNVRVENQNINDGSIGIQLGYSDDNIIINNSCKLHNWAGIELQESSGNLIQYNICSDIFWGIMLFYSSNNIIKNNTVSSNSIEGMSIHSGSGNTITNNNFTSNDIGVDISSSNNNNIYYNNFISNDQQAADDGSNNWDNYLEGGNYWDDYNGYDNGANGRVEGDGIGDTNIPHLNLDNYPFISPSGWFYPGIPILLDPGEFDTNGEYTIFWDKMRGTTGYILEEDESSSFASSKVIYEGSELYFKIIGKNNGTYYYRLKAYNDKIESEWSSIVDIIVDWPPNIPQNLLASANPEGNVINLSWDLNLDDTKEYDIYFKTTGIWELIDTIAHPNHTYNHTELTDGDHYYYKVQARDFRGQLSDFSNTVDSVPADIVRPSPPIGFVINALSSDSLLLNWEPNPENDVQGYNIYRNTTPTVTDWGDPINGVILIQQLNYTDVNLDEFTTYYYVITAVDEVPYESDYSEVINATTLLDEHGPELNNSLADFEISEDTYDDSSINLYHWFKDVNSDKLIFSCKGQDHIEVTIHQKNGTVILMPEKNWNGIERLTFYASDKDKETSDKVVITVTEVNDPPGPAEIITPRTNIKIDDGELLDFEVHCDDPDLKYGDELDFNWSSNITGEIGNGDTLSDIVLPIGRHLITLEVSDNEGETSIDTVKIYVLETPESDSDEDGIPNIWEREYGLDPKDPTDANEDPDNDGKTNLEEYLNETNPTVNEEKDDNGMDYYDFIRGLIITAIIFILIFLIVVIKLGIAKRRKEEDVMKDITGVRLPLEKPPHESPHSEAPPQVQQVEDRPIEPKLTLMPKMEKPPPPKPVPRVKKPKIVDEMQEDEEE